MAAPPRPAKGRKRIRRGPGQQMIGGRDFRLADEVRYIYLDGKIDQWYSLEDRSGVVFILNMTDTQAAHAMLEELPLGKAHLMTFQLTPIGPLNPLRQLLVPAVPH